MSLLTIIQDACLDLNIAKPSSVVGDTDAQVTQLLQIAQREGRDLATRHLWSALVKENSWTITLAANQGALNGTVVTASDFDSFIPETMWNRTTTLPILESTNQTEWQAVQAYGITGPYQRYDVREGDLYIDPVPTSADSAYFAYKSKFWCESSAGAGQTAWAADTDVGLLDEELMTLGIIWRWRKRKSLEYSEDFNTYEKRVSDKAARDGANRRLNLNSPGGSIVPGVTINPWSPIR